MGLLGIERELARHRDDLVARHTGDRLGPGRRVGLVVVIARRQVFAAEAAVNATPEDLVKLRILVDKLQEGWEARDGGRIAVADADFHLALAASSHNPLALAIFHGFSRLLRKLIEAEYTLTGFVEESFRTHGETYEAIAAGDAAQAAEAMRQHFLTGRPIPGIIEAE